MWSIAVYRRALVYARVEPRADDCARIVRDELLSGVDDPSSAVYTPGWLDGIVPRLAMALNREAELDTANTWDWGQYCMEDPDHGTAIDWGNVVVAGHSFGGNQAAYISYRTPVQGAMVLDSGYDVCEASAPTSSPLSEDVYDASHPYNSSGEPALWYSTYSDASVNGRVFVYHETEPFPGISWPQLPPALQYMTTGEQDAGTLEANVGSLYAINTVTAWGAEPFVSTNQISPTSIPAYLPLAGFEPHMSLANDEHMPSTSYGYVNPMLSGPSSLQVDSTYVDVMCALGAQ